MAKNRYFSAGMISQANVDPVNARIVRAIAFQGGFKSQANVEKPNLKLVNARIFSASFKSQADIIPPRFKIVNARIFSARFSSEAEITANFTTVDALFLMADMPSRATVTGILIGGSDTDGLSLRQLVAAELSLWGIFSVCSAPAWAIERAINDINGALQLVWNNAEGRNYWSTATLTLTLASGVSSQNLPNNIQNVTGPCRISTTKRTLCPVGSIGELETFEDIYLDGRTTSEPVAYHIQRSEQSLMDSAKCVFLITPPVGATPMSFLLDVTHEAPRFSKYDIEQSPQISLPHAYAETLLLPIIFYKASSYHMFRQPDQKPTIDREYQQAMVSLGLADPLPGLSGDNSKKGERVTA